MKGLVVEIKSSSDGNFEELSVLDRRNETNLPHYTAKWSNSKKCIILIKSYSSDSHTLCPYSLKQPITFKRKDSNRHYDHTGILLKWNRFDDAQEYSLYGYSVHGQHGLLPMTSENDYETRECQDKSN